MSTLINSDTQYIDESTGELINNGFIYIGLDGLDAKLNPATIYSDRALSVVLANPQRTGADGRAVNKIWVDGKYSMKVENPANVQKLNRLTLGELTQTGSTNLVNVQGADSLAADASPVITELTNNQIYILTAVANNTGAMTLTIDLTPTWPIKKHHDNDMLPNDIESGQTLAVIFNETDSIFELMTNSAIGPVNLDSNQTIAGVKTFSGTLVTSKGADVASATALTLGTDGNSFDITGTTTITSIATLGVGTHITLQFDGILTLTHHATNLVLPNSNNITTYAGYILILYEYATGDFRFVSDNREEKTISSVTASVAASALTVGLNADILDFRSATLTDGVPAKLSFGDLSLVVPAGATLETIDTIANRVYLLVINNAGTAELAIVNSAGGVNLNEEGVISTTALSTGSDLNDVIYSTTARSSVPYRVVGLVESTQATAGIWATAPSLIQGMGGNALTSMSSLGYGQTWQAVTRSMSTTYYNTTGKPISFQTGSANFTSGVVGSISVSINGGTAITISKTTTNGSVAGGTYDGGSIIIPVGASYIFSHTNWLSWSPWELR